MSKDSPFIFCDFSNSWLSWANDYPFYQRAKRPTPC